jgi:hypothetical protein
MSNVAPETNSFKTEALKKLNVALIDAAPEDRKASWGLFQRKEKSVAVKDPHPISSPPKKEPASKPATSKAPVVIKEKKKDAEKIIPGSESKNDTPTLPCRHCNRPFYEDRLAKHEAICLKMQKSREKRGDFDSKKMRIQGTELEATKLSKSNNRTKSAPAPTSKSSNWRKQHEEFIEALRLAKKVQAHVAKGGKASDIDVPIKKNDGKECPHCHRKFGDSSFERHVAICANLKHFGPR